ARLGEPHIIPIHDFGEIDGILYLDMRLVEGEDLRSRLRRTGPLPPADAVALTEQLAAALDAAHAVGLVHRDVKPENVLVTNSDFAYLVDFGIAHQAADTRLTQAGTAIGSLAYMAPEQLDGAPSAPTSDVYSLAAVLYEMLTGAQPFPGATVSQVVRATVMNEVPSPRAMAPAVSAQLDAVAVRGLAKDPGVRFASAGELASAARAALAGHWPGGDSVPTTTMPTTVPTTSMPTGSGGYDPTMIGQMPPAAAYSGPQGHSGQRIYSGQQNHPGGPGYSGPYQVPPPPYYAPPGAAFGTSGYPPQEREGRALQVVLGALIGLLVLALIGIAVYWFGFRDSTGSGSVAAPSSTTTLTTTVEPQPTTATPPPGTVNCSAEVGVASSVTSCEFAYNVRSAYLSASPDRQARTVVASSPVTGMSYSMNCNPESGVVVCRGGNNAVVVIF
ncbi:MAG: serine/threonine-protein kinase, partial [Gordonia sp. (in: high G+C Gram-positive bacteria)]|uniref:serine/threonine-protein kinase n=1 Tax=Gordonia sp. (in: high G+C Gram-positive bacteria) TaxID=84139 RepID=UPI003C71129E